ncbi:MAG: PEP/pyruvate-binding domain-containing protein [Polyangiaceae bacterium]
MAPSSASFARPLTEAGGHLSLVGGKARNLSELLRGGFPVPDGFTVTTAGYARAAESAGVARLLDEIAAAPLSDRARLADLAAAAREALEKAPIDADVARDVLEGYASLGDAVPVAVRSSATAEDLAAQSFAGQQDTYLDVVGPDAVLDAVRRCWASLFTERAVVYRAQNGVDQRGVQLAVVVQRMVRAATAGVLFTANPITGRRRQAVIDVHPGLGELVVSGQVNPDHLIVDTATGRVISQRLGDGERAAPCLSEAQIRELVTLGAKVEAHFGAPQDIELAFDREGRLWLTQSRPITTLFPLPPGAPRGDDDLRVYASSTADEGVTRPITPMGLQAFRILAGACAEMFWGAGPADRAEAPSPVVETALRTYYDLTPLVRSSLSRRILLGLMPSADAHTAALLGALDQDPRLAPRPTTLRQVWRAVAVPIGRTSLIRGLAKALVSPERARRDGRAVMDAALSKGDFDGADPRERLDRALEALWAGYLALPDGAYVEMLAGFLLSGVVEVLVGDRASSEELQTAMLGLPNNPTTEMNLALWALAAQLRSNEAVKELLHATPPEDLARAFHERTLPEALSAPLRRFLDRYGHRAVAEVDLGLPRWSEDPTYLFGVLANYLRLAEDAVTPDALFTRAERDGLAMKATLEARCVGPRRALVRLALDRARALGGVRDQWKYELSAIFARTRRLLLTVGDALVTAGRLAARDDIFFVSLPEARRGLDGEDLRPLVEMRRAEYQSELRRRRVPAILLSDGTEPVAPEPATTLGAANELRGTPASPGKVRGRARVLSDPVGARIEPGEVLVAPSTDPGWTPLFMTAGGLVMEKGGAISHGAVVAREVGIPAVVGVPGAVTRIRTGQMIEVDGSSGVIRWEEPQEGDQPPR